MLVLALEHKYVVESAYLISAIFYFKECMVYVKCFSCSAHFISCAYNSNFVSNQKLFPIILYPVSNSLQNILTSLLHGSMLCS